ncbi:hypothetical protein ABTY96_03290 [Streptomyces sp. NPDC096057]|uniref:hypothetical protein n=1 Tax=Streptomyces sp. NPDC096057 TaxID=3155543 RepID=UPI00331A9939
MVTHDPADDWDRHYESCVQDGISPYAVTAPTTARETLVDTLTNLLARTRNGRMDTHRAEAKRMVDEAFKEATERIIPDREHIVDVHQRDMAGLRTWLGRPNGSKLINDRVSFEAVGHGGVWVRTKPYRYKAPGVRS